MNRLLTALLLLAPFVVQAADHTVQQREGVTVAAGTTYSFSNLVGDVTVVSHDGDEIVIEATVTAASAELAEAVGIARDGNELWMTFPVEEHTHYLYRPSGGGNMNTSTTYRGTRVHVSSRGDGAEVSASVRILLPRGAMLDVNQSVGSMGAAGTDGTVSLRGGSGRITLSDTRGGVTARSGSGTVMLDGHMGAATLHTGSGSVGVSDMHGDLSVRTGSGSVRVEGLAHAGKVSVSTGSGSVRVEGDLSGVDDMEFSTGSGSVTIEATGMPDVQLEARAGSGSVRVEVDGTRLPETDRNRVEATLGDGNGTARITTGSGSIRFTIRN